MTAEAAPFLLILSAGATLIGIPVMMLRFNWFRSLFTVGQEIEGRVVRVWFYRGRGRVEFCYEYQGQEYAVGRAVGANRQTRMLKVGDSVPVLVDPANPRKAAIRDLYQ